MTLTRSPAVVGLDLSLTETGVVWADGTAATIPTGKLRGAERLAMIREDVRSICAVEIPEERPDLVVIEEAGRRLQGPAMAVVELHGVIRVLLYELGIPTAYVQPATLKKFATGKGNADKPAMMAAAIRLFGYEGDNQNEADAWMLRVAAEVHYSGRRDLAQVRLDALEKVDWPVIA